MPSSTALDVTLYEKTLATVHVKADEKERITIGMMTVGSIDSDNEIVDQQSALESMPAFLASGGPVQYNHDQGGNIGRCVGYEPMVINQGKWVPAGSAEPEGIQVTTLYGKGYQVPTLFHGQVSVDDIWQQIAQKMLRTHSIRFIGQAEDPADAAAGGASRLIVRRTLEYSVVTIPAQADAVLAVQLAKAAGFAGCPDCAAAMKRKLAEWRGRVGEEQGRAIVEAAKHKVATPDLNELLASLHRLAHVLEESR